MSDPDPTTIVSSIVPVASNEHEIEHSDIRTSGDDDSIGSNTSSSHKKSNSIMNRFQKIVKKFDFINVEGRGIERILPEDRTDSTIINTGMLWVRNLFI